MKKVVLLVFVFIWFFGIWFTSPYYAPNCVNWKVGENNLSCQACEDEGQLYNPVENIWWVQFYAWCCPKWSILQDDPQNPNQNICISNTVWNMWINMDSDCLINWQCSLNIYKTLWIRKSNQDPTVSTFFQDIVLWATMFLGTVITIILVVSWILYISAAISGKSNSADMAKKWIFNSILWLLFVVWSYAIIRLIQFIATAGGW